jgi:hypothetical protein
MTETMVLTFLGTVVVGAGAYTRDWYFVVIGVFIQIIALFQT